MTCKSEQARRFLEDIGPEGRMAYQKLYLCLDFWFSTRQRTSLIS